MAMRLVLTEPTDPVQDFLREVARLRPTPEERARILADAPVFDPDAWIQKVGPATPEELAETEQFLREREAERQRDLNAELNLVAVAE